MPLSQEDVANVDRLCQQLYTCASNDERRAAEQQLAPLSELANMDNVLHLVGQSSSPATTFVACVALRRMVTSSWEQLTMVQMCALQDFVVHVLNTKGPQMDSQVATSFAALLAQTTKLAWALGEAPRAVPGKVHSTFLHPSAPAAHRTLGLALFTQLVAEVSDVAVKRSLEDHRDTLSRFRDAVLADVFRVAVEEVAQAHRTGDAGHMNKALGLVRECLGFDFRCAIPDPAVDMGETIFPPDAWRPMLQGVQLTQLLWDVYGASIGSPRAAAALECLSLAVSLPRSFFDAPEARAVWVETQLVCSCKAMADGKGLQDDACYVKFSRILACFKANNSLSALVACPSYPQWISQCTAFSIAVFPRLDADHGNLFSLWASLTVSKNRLDPGDNPSGLDECVPKVTVAYIESRLQAGKWCTENPDEDNPLTAPEECTAQLQSMSKLITPFYSQVGQVIMWHLQRCTADIQQPQTMCVAEAQAAWLVYIVGVVVAGHGGDFGEEVVTLDAQFGAAVLQMCETLRGRASLPGAAQDEQLQHLERAIVFFFRELRRMFITEDFMQNKVLLKMQALLQAESLLAVVRAIATKVVANMQQWGSDETIISDTLQLFSELTLDPLTIEELKKIDFIQMLVLKRGQCALPFLNSHQLIKARCNIHRTLAKILLTMGHTADLFNAFLAPQAETLDRLVSTDRSAWGTEPLMGAVIGLASDLKGVGEACHTEQAYSALLQWLSSRFLVLADYLQHCPPNPDVTNRLLKCYREVFHNRRSRIPHNPLLAQYVTRVLAVVSQRKAPAEGASDVWKAVHKPLYLTLVLLDRVLGGRYMDVTSAEFRKALFGVLEMMCGLPTDDLLAYPKLSRAYFCLVGELFDRHSSLLQDVPAPAFMKLCDALLAVLKKPHVNRRMANRALSAIDRLCTAHDTFRPHIHGTDLLPQFAGLVFPLCLFDARWNAAPILPLNLVREDTKHIFLRYLETVSGRIASDAQRQQFSVAVREFLEGIPGTLEPSSREAFNKQLSAFRSKALPLLGGQETSG